MKKIADGQVLYNKEIATDIFQMSLLLPDIAENAVAGQFVEVYMGQGEHLLPRPISICGIDKEKGCVTLVYQRVGSGTRYFSGLVSGGKLRVIGPLGNGYRIVDNAPHYILVGGGIGIPPLLRLAVELRANINGGNITAYLGFRKQPFLVQPFREYCNQVHVATDDGSVGFHGNVVQLMENECVHGAIYACGPKVMLKTLAGWAAAKGMPCQVSLEERMACGLGACVGCAVKIKSPEGWAYKKACKDGPVFNAEEVAWDA